jgi:hypothetical protein
MKRASRYARSKGPPGGFVKLHHIVLGSAQFAALSPRAVKLLLDLLAQYRGNNNGDLCATWTLMHSRGWRSRDQLHKALLELIERQWIVQTRQGGMHAPSLYATTIFALDPSAKIEITAPNFPRGEWAQISPPAMSIRGASSSPPGVSIEPESARRQCQLPAADGSIVPPAVSFEPVSAHQSSRRQVTSIDVAISPDAVPTPHPPEEPTNMTHPKITDPTPPAELWQAYSTAYFTRYGVEPVRNAKVNGQLSQVIKRLGAREAPHVAAHYLRSSNGYYIRRGHPVDCLLNDAEKLRTEWARGQHTTEAEARHADATAARGNVFGKLIDGARRG